MSQLPDWIGVDWGTSNLRAWGLSDDGDVLFERSSGQGMGTLEPLQFAPVLEALLSADLPMGADPIDVVVCGMAGARQGWHEAGYFDVPADLTRLGSEAVAPKISDGSPMRPRILSGLCQRGAGVEDVMRGEETQLLGLSVLKQGFSGVICMPGTHSKWVKLDGGIVQEFATAMTGELYDVLSTHSVLRHSLNGDLEGPELEPGIAAGLLQGLEAPERLSSQLFKVRSASLLSDRTADWCAGYLSGLLVGAEVAGFASWRDGSPVMIVGSERLGRLYGQALRAGGVQSEFVDATAATIAGLTQARKQVVHG